MKHGRAHFHVTTLLALLAVTAAGCAGGMAGSSGGLHIWSAGSSVEYKSISSQVMVMEVPGQGEMTIGTDVSMDVNVEATATPRQFYLTIQDVSISSDAAAMGGDMPDVSLLKGLESTILLDARGLITEASNLEGNSSIEEQGGVAAFKEQIQGFFLYSPEGVLGPGVEWTREVEIPIIQMGMVMTISSIDKYRCIEATTFGGAPAYKIAMTTEVAMSGSGEQMGMPMDMAMTGSGEGTFYVETGTGMLLSAEGTISMIGGVSGAGFDMPIEIRMTTAVELKK